MKQYIVKRGGVELTMQLSDEDAKRMNARPVPAKPAPSEVPAADSDADEAESKAKGEAEAQAAADAKALTPSNKARAPQNK